MKVISKNEFQGLSYEAEVLCSLRHPGIPILYDYEEDDEVICLVEEYIRGVSLTEYLLHHSTISRDWIYRTMKQLCEILEYLHEQQPKPILYQDLKPEHVMLQGDQVILIDYGIAYPKGETRYGAGTPEHSAPEQFVHTLVDERSDIYALGKIAQLLYAHLRAKMSRRERVLIQRTLAPNPMERPATVKEWLASFEAAMPKASEKKGKHFPEEIAVIGAARGVGTTHVAIALTAYLNQHHQKAFFVDKTNQHTLQRILRQRGEYKEKDGIIYHNTFAGILDMGPAIPGTTPPKGIRVVDCGTDWEMARESDFYLYICSARPWLDEGLHTEKAMDPQCRIILNPGNPGVGRGLAKQLYKKVYGFPVDSDPFLGSKEKDKLWKRIWESEEGREGMFKSFKSHPKA